MTNMNGELEKFTKFHEVASSRNERENLIEIKKMLQ